MRVVADEPFDFFKALAKPQPSPTFPDIASIFGLPSLPIPPVIQRRWFKGDTIHIDGYVFEDCRFDGCTLVTEMATFAFRRCYIAANCRLYFNGAALKTVRLLMHYLRTQNRIQMRQDEQGVYATLNADGTFSLE